MWAILEVHFKCLKIEGKGAGGILQQLKAFAAPAEDQGSILSTNSGLESFVMPVPGDPMPSFLTSVDI